MSINKQLSKNAWGEKSVATIKGTETRKLLQKLNTKVASAAMELSGISVS